MRTRKERGRMKGLCVDEGSVGGMRAQTRMRQTDSERWGQDRYEEMERKRSVQVEDGGWKQQRKRTTEDDGEE